jgi:tRNA-2-methylthio-N6-dimethylallyladenosine synthase
MRPALEIIAEAEQAVSTGHSEIHLLGQIVNHYTAPDLKNCDFARLLELLQEVRGVQRIRFASPHPRHVTDRMLGAIKDLPAVCNHLHLPVQSGSTSVLKAMNRKHSAEQYRALVEKIRQTIPDIALSTDMIVGFPTETDADFQKTLELTTAAKYHSMFSFKYSERPNTLAKSKLQDIIPESVKSERLLELQLTQKRIQVSINQAQIGKVVEVLADSRSRRRRSELSGRTSQNTVVNFSGNNHKIGEILNIEIREAGPNSLCGDVIPSEPIASLQPITADNSNGNIVEQARRSHAG